MRRRYTAVMNETPKKHWPRFSIRELALLVLTIALAIGWYRERRLFLELRAAVKGVSSITGGWPPTQLYDNAFSGFQAEVDGYPVNVIVTPRRDGENIVGHPQPKGTLPSILVFP